MKNNLACHRRPNYFSRTGHDKCKSIIPPLSNSLEVWSFAFYEAKLFAKNFSKNCNLDDWGIVFTCFPSRNNLTRHNISVTPKMVKKVITAVDLSKTSVWSWLYANGGSEELWAWTFIHTSWTLQYVPWGVLFSRLLKGLISGPCKECWRKAYN